MSTYKYHNHVQNHSSGNPDLEEESVVGELRVCGLEGGEDAGNGDGCCALNVVVEGAVRVAVLLEEPEGVVVAKVLKLDERVLAVVLDHGLHELVDEVVVLLARDAPVPAANVVHVLKRGYSVTYGMFILK